MQDIVISSTYAASAAAISLAAFAQAKFSAKSAHSKLYSNYELQAHLFSCVSLSLAYGLHAVT